MAEQHLAARFTHAEESRRTMVVGTGRLYPTQTGENSIQETMLRRFRRHVASEETQ